MNNKLKQACTTIPTENSNIWCMIQILCILTQYSIHVYICNRYVMETFLNESVPRHNESGVLKHKATLIARKLQRHSTQPVPWPVTPGRLMMLIKMGFVVNFVSIVMEMCIMLSSSAIVRCWLHAWWKSKCIRLTSGDQLTWAPLYAAIVLMTTSAATILMLSKQCNAWIFPLEFHLLGIQYL